MKVTKRTGFYSGRCGKFFGRSTAAHGAALLLIAGFAALFLLFGNGKAAGGRMLNVFVVMMFDRRCRIFQQAFTQSTPVEMAECRFPEIRLCPAIATKPSMQVD
jgi:hypothetical protein